jgi:peroxiredoxin
MAHSGTTITVGDSAPLFTLLNTKGTPRSLDDYLAHRPVLLAFHRGTW